VFCKRGPALNVVRNLALSLLITAGVVLAVRHGATALHPTLPKDMPADSRFVQSGYDLQHNEPKGDWVSCTADSPDDTDFCRVTDNHGTVIYQGDFMSVSDTGQVPAGQLQIASMDSRELWVEGPGDALPVPAIALTNGKTLVPAVDSGALAVRWRKNPR
jgi:hypothetical protein